MSQTKWATARDSPEYHRVTFSPGPNISEEAAACGKVARFWPRVGVQVDASYCPECWHVASEKEKSNG
jgi:hypothetical protein